MQEKEARDLIKESLRQVNWINFARVLESLTEFDFNRYDNNKWRPNFKKAGEDQEWLEANFSKLLEAFKTIKDKP